jgi:hypothetical protein
MPESFENLGKVVAILLAYQTGNILEHEDFGV